MNAAAISILIDPVEFAGTMGRISGLLSCAPIDPYVCRVVL